MPKPLVEIKDVRVRRDAVVVLDTLSMEVAAGSLHALVGQNGAGKSTLFSALLGFTDFDGSIRFHYRGNGRIGYVPQRFAVDRTLPLTVAEFLTLHRRRRPVCLGLGAAALRKADALLETVGLQGYARRPLHALSGGELQRVLLANALDPLPELLLLDEPATGLDQASIARFEQILVALETTVLMISHDLEQARRIADQITTLGRA
jgi:zinc transport system ATP-binding protein